MDRLTQKGKNIARLGHGLPPRTGTELVEQSLSGPGPSLIPGPPGAVGDPGASITGPKGDKGDKGDGADLFMAEIMKRISLRG